jgi:hypothetical protein
VVLEADGALLQVRDPRGLVAFTYRRDMLGRVLQVSSIDAGDAWTLPDGLDRTALVWDARGFEAEHSYDALDRPLSTHVRGLGLDHRVEERSYGESVADAAARNLRGCAVRVCDAAGELVIDGYDPAGDPLTMTRRVRRDDGEPDWRSPVVLDDEPLASRWSYDALGRRRSEQLADGIARTFSYLRGGGLERLQLTSHGRLTAVPVIDGASTMPTVPHRLVLGGGVQIGRRYDETRRLTGSGRCQRTCRTSAAPRSGQQPDPAGRAAHRGPDAVIRAAPCPRGDYRYDSHYRLVRATGRVRRRCSSTTTLGAPIA